MDLELVGFEGVDRVDLRGAGGFFEPAGGAVGVFAGNFDESVVDGVLVHVVESG